MAEYLVVTVGWILVFLGAIFVIVVVLLGLVAAGQKVLKKVSIQPPEAYKVELTRFLDSSGQYYVFPVSGDRSGFPRPPVVSVRGSNGRYEQKLRNNKN